MEPTQFRRETEVPQEVETQSQHNEMLLSNTMGNRVDNIVQNIQHKGPESIDNIMAKLQEQIKGRGTPQTLETLLKTLEDILLPKDIKDVKL